MLKPADREREPKILDEPYLAVWKRDRGVYGGGERGRLRVDQQG